MTNPQDLEPRLSRVEVDLQELKQVVAETSRNVSELRSSIVTLADLVTIQQNEAQSDREQARVNKSETDQRFEESRQRFDRFVKQAQAEQEQARADRALMLQLIQSIAQGRNGGN